MYWTPVTQQNLPVTVKYPEMVAEKYPHFESNNIPEFGKENLWFLKIFRIAKCCFAHYSKKI